MTREESGPDVLELRSPRESWSRNVPPFIAGNAISTRRSSIEAFVSASNFFFIK